MALQALTRATPCYHYVDGEKVPGVHSSLCGDVSGIRGDVSGIYGNVSDIHGNVSGIRGNLDECNITEEERAAGVDINTLVIKENKQGA